MGKVTRVLSRASKAMLGAFLAVVVRSTNYKCDLTHPWVGVVFQGRKCIVVRNRWVYNERKALRIGFVRRERIGSKHDILFAVLLFSAIGSRLL